MEGSVDQEQDLAVLQGNLQVAQVGMRQLHGVAVADHEGDQHDRQRCAYARGTSDVEQPESADPDRRSTRNYES